ncbi:MAG: hypothetical protein ABII26_04035, partial [Pseudomonadota bacterium]
HIRVTWFIFGSIALFLCIVWGRAFYGSMRSYHEGEKYLSQQKYIKAITFFDRSIHWYTPFNPYIEGSVERLWEIGIHAEKEGDIRLALIAFQTIRGGFIAARSFFSPGKSWIEKCQLKIEEIVKRTEKQREDREGLDASVKDHLPIQRIVTPGPLWSGVVEIGFLGWIGGVIGFIIFGVGRKEKVLNYKVHFLTWMAITAFFFTLWIVGMMKA